VCQDHLLDVMLEATKGHIFWVRFRKALTKKQRKAGQELGDERDMYAKLHGEQTLLRKGFTSVREVQRDSGTGKPVMGTTQKRSINNRTLRELKFDGVHWIADGIE
jgi:hypothetical protein